MFDLLIVFCLLVFVSLFAIEIGFAWFINSNFIYKNKKKTKKFLIEFLICFIIFCLLLSQKAN